MVFRNLEAEGGELHEVIVVHFCETPKFRREDQWWRAPKIYEAKMSAGTYFTVEHGRNLARMIFGVQAEGVASGHGLRQAQIQVFEKLRRCLAVAVEFAEHKSLKGVVHRRCDLCRNDSVPLSINQENASGC